jgi:hypothetical protein
MNNSTDDDIPTLTDVIQSGDAGMKNHFDAHFFDPAEQLADREHEAFEPEQLRDLIQEALDETLPVIEEQLREQLTQKVLEKLNRE